MYPMQTDWKVKKDKTSRLLGKLLWNTTQLHAFVLGAKDDYNFINRVYDAQLKLFQINAKRLS